MFFTNHLSCRHAFLGEEGGISGNNKSVFLWAIDPLDGTTNFSHNYPSFGVSVAGLFYVAFSDRMQSAAILLHSVCHMSSLGHTISKPGNCDIVML